MATGSSKKRLFEDEDEFKNLSEMHATKRAKFHGIISSLSPLKSSARGTTNFFHGQLTDGKQRKQGGWI